MALMIMMVTIMMTYTFLRPLGVNENEQPKEMSNNQLTIPGIVNTAFLFSLYFKARQALKPG